MAATTRQRERQKERVSAAKRRAQEHGSGNFTALNIPPGMQLLKVDKKGTYKWDIIPYRVSKNSLKFAKNYADPGELYFERTYFVNYNVGANESAYVSPSRTFGKRDPIAEYRQKLEADETSNEEAIKALIPKERQLFLVWDRTTEADEAKGVQLLEIAHWNFGKLLDSRVSAADDSDPDVAHIPFFYEPDENGSTLRVTFDEEPSGGRKPYLKASAIDFIQRRKPLPQEILDQAVCLDDVPKEIEYEALRRIFMQLPDDGSEPDEELNGAPPPGRAGRRGGTKPAAPESAKAEANGDEAPWGDEEEEAPSPKPSRPAKAGRGKPITAESAGIEQGDLVLYDERKYEVGKISKDGTSLKLIDDESGDLLDHAVGVAEVTKVEEDWGDETLAPEAETEPEFEEEEAPKPARAKAGGKTKAPPPVAADEDDWGGDEDVPTPAKTGKGGKAPAKPAAKAPAKAAVADDDDWD